MTMQLNDADRADRQARIEDDIRQLFARYRSAKRSGAQTPSSTRFTPTREPSNRFRRDGGTRVTRRTGGG
jgi:hypothetical protein